MEMLSKEQHIRYQRQVEHLTSTPQVMQLKLHQTQKHQIPASSTNPTLGSRCWEMLRVMVPITGLALRESHSLMVDPCDISITNTSLKDVTQVILSTSQSSTK